MEQFRKIRVELLKRKILIFGTGNNHKRRDVHIGGPVKVSELKKIHYELKNYRICSFSMKQLANKRSYKIILDCIFQDKLMSDELMRFNKVNMIEVDRNGRDQNLRYFLNTLSKIEVAPV